LAYERFTYFWRKNRNSPDKHQKHLRNSVDNGFLRVIFRSVPFWEPIVQISPPSKEINQISPPSEKINQISPSLIDFWSDQSLRKSSDQSLRKCSGAVRARSVQAPGRAPGGPPEGPRRAGVWGSAPSSRRQSKLSCGGIPPAPALPTFIQ
jgi:hypothetical protein